MTERITKREKTLKQFINKINKRVRLKELSRSKAILMLRGKKEAITRKKKNALKNEAMLKKEIKKRKNINKRG